MNNPKMKFKNSIYHSTQNIILKDKSKMSKICTLETSKYCKINLEKV